MQGFVWKKFNALFRYIFISFIIHALYQCYTYSHVSLPNLCALRCLPHLNLCLLVDGVQAIYNMLGNAITDVNIDTPKERTVKIFSKMDTNNDGVLTKEEFTQGCMNDQCLYQMLTADAEGPNSSGQHAISVPVHAWM